MHEGTDGDWLISWVLQGSSALLCYSYLIFEARVTGATNLKFYNKGVILHLGWRIGI